ncbi:MAG: hypothetical protein Q8Q46_03555 [Candidatus Giovannonibacteria bacterium]|nr:hypothetical protein [Candidatus Giovannonibacteria bacterium]
MLKMLTKLEKITFIVLLVFVAVGLSAVMMNYYKSKAATPEQFDTELAETNRQADVASQLRAAGKRDLVKFKTGDIRPISFKDGVKVFLCEFVASPPLSQVERVIKYGDPDWSEKAFKYCPYVRPQ